MRVKPPARATMPIMASMWYFHAELFDCWSCTGHQPLAQKELKTKGRKMGVASTHLGKNKHDSVNHDQKRIPHAWLPDLRVQRRDGHPAVVVVL